MSCRYETAPNLTNENWINEIIWIKFHQIFTKETKNNKHSSQLLVFFCFYVRNTFGALFFFFFDKMTIDSGCYVVY